MGSFSMPLDKIECLVQQRVISDLFWKNKEYNYQLQILIHTSTFAEDQMRPKGLRIQIQRVCSSHQFL